MARKRKYAVVGEFVRVLVPKQFIRCGYPLSIKDILSRDLDAIEDDFRRVFSALENRPEPEPVKETDDWFGLAVAVQPTTSATVHGMLCSAIAAYRLEKEGFGGKDRQIVESDSGVFEQGQVWVVVARKMVKTGTRYPSWSSEDDYEPGGLDNEKSHCVYTVSRNRRKAKILAVNCEVVRDL